MSRISGIAVLIVVLLGGVWLFGTQDQSGATLSDSEAVRSSIQAETVDISISDVDGAIATFTLENMAPGDEFRGEIVIANGGGVPVLYGITSEADPSPLNDLLVLNVWTGPGRCDVGELPTSLVFSGALSDATSDVIGEMATQTNYRPLGEGQFESICAQITLPLEVGNEAQNQISRQRFTVLAIQDVANTQ